MSNHAPNTWHGTAKRPAITATKAKRLPAKKKEASGGRNPQRRARYLVQSTGGCMETQTLRRISNSRQVSRAILKEQQCEFGRPSEMY